MSSGSSRRGASDRFRPRRGGFDDGSLSSHPAHPSRSPHCPGPSDSGWHGPRISQANNDITASIPSWRLARLIISSIHLIPFPSWSVSPVISLAHLVMRLGQASRTIYPGHQRELMKQANEHERTERPRRETGSRDGAKNGTNTTRQRDGDGARTDGKQGEGKRGHATQLRTRTMPLIILARPPLLGSPLSAGLI